MATPAESPPPDFENPVAVARDDLISDANTSTGWQAIALTASGNIRFHDHDNAIATILYRHKTRDILIQFTGKCPFAWDVSIKTDLMYGRWFDEDTPDHPTEIVINLPRVRWERFPIIKKHSIPLGRDPKGYPIVAVLAENDKSFTIIRENEPGSEFCLAMVSAGRQHPREKLRTYMPYYPIFIQERGEHDENGEKHIREEGKAGNEYVMTMYPVLVAANVPLSEGRDSDVFVASESMFYHEMPLAAR